MDFDNIAVGIDIENVSRFSCIKKTDTKWRRVFTENETEYSFSQGNPAQHLCARFCAKEAAIKALSEFNIRVKLSDIEILNAKSSKPELTVKGYKNIKAKVSLTHTKETAAAVVILKN